MANYGTILVVDDNPAILTAAEICLEGVFERVITLSTPEKILPTLQQEEVDVVHADVKLAVKGLKSGAVDFVTKPWDNDELIHVLKDAIDNNKRVVPLDQIETEHVRKVVEKCHGNISKAAELLGITRQTLYAKMRKP